MSFFIRNADGLFATWASVEILSEEQLDRLDALLVQWRQSDPAWAARAQAVRDAIEPFRGLSEQWNALTNPQASQANAQALPPVFLRLHTLVGWNAQRPFLGLSAQELHLVKASFDATTALQALRTDFDKIHKMVCPKGESHLARQNPLRGVQRMLDERSQWVMDECSHAQRLLSSRAIAVLHMGFGLYLGENHYEVDISRARSYETLAAAERSLSALGFTSEDRALHVFVEVQTQITRLVAEHAFVPPVHDAVQEALATMESAALRQALDIAPLETLKRRVAQLEAAAITGNSGDPQGACDATRPARPEHPGSIASTQRDASAARRRL